MYEHDPNTCPRCGSDSGFQETGVRVVWQGARLERETDGTLTVSDWHEYSVGDDTDQARFECRTCLWSWESLAALRIDQDARALVVNKIADRGDEDGRFAVDDADAFLGEILAAVHFAPETIG